MRQTNNRDVIGWLLVTLLLGLTWHFCTGPFDRLVLLNTLGLGFSASLIAIPFGLLLARTALRTGWFARTTLVLVLATAFIPLVFQVSFWDAAFGKLGWLTAASTGQNEPLVSGWAAASWIHAISLTPQIALIFLAAFWTGDRVHEEQALLECSPVRVFWTITMRRMLPVLLLCLLWCIINCAREIAATDIYQVGTLAEQVYLGFSLGQFDSFLGNWTADEMARASTLGIGAQILAITWLVISAAIFFFRFLSDRDNSENLRLQQPVRTSNRNYLLNTATAIAWILMAAIPLYNLLARASFHVARVDGQPQPGYSIEQFFSAIQLAAVQYMPQTRWSILMGFGCAVSSIVLGTLIAWGAKTHHAVRWATVIFVSICFALPGPIVGSGLAQAMTLIDTPWSNFVFDRTLFAPMLATSIVCLPIAVVLCYFVFDLVADDVQQHAATEGAGTVTTFFKFGIGGNWRPLVGIFILSFVIAYGELAASQMVLPAGVETVPRLTLGLMHSGVNEMTAALTIINITAIVLISLCGWWLVSLKRTDGEQQ